MKRSLFFAIIAALCMVACNSKVPELTGISLNKKKLTLEVGETYRLKVSFTPEEVAEAAPEVKWLSSDEDVATVKNGKVTAIAVGKATITATCSKHEAECVLTVVEAGDEPEPVTESRLVLNSYDIELLFDQTFQLVATIETDEGEQTPEDPVIWSNIHTNVATVDETGLVTANQRGFDTITATCGELSAQCAVYVMPRTIKTGFSVSESKLVFFAPGNLRYSKSSRFRVHDEQYATVGSDNMYIASSDYTSDIDLFGWGTGMHPTLYSTSISDYETWTDWGSVPVSDLESGSWRTPSKDEWEYLLSGRENADKLKSLAKIEGIAGFLLLPDGWWPPKRLWITPNATDCETNRISATTWIEMERYGAVFLPCAGWRTETRVHETTTKGCYWSSTPTDDTNDIAYAFEFGIDSGSNPMGEIKPEYNYNGYAVRLIRNVLE